MLLRFLIGFLMQFISVMSVWGGASVLAYASAGSIQKEFDLARQAYQQQDYAKAEAILLKLEKKIPHSLSVQNNLAAIDIQKQRYAEAKKRLTQVINQQPELAYLFKNLNQIYAYEAQQSYQKVFQNIEVKKPSPKLISSLSQQDIQTLKKQATLQKTLALKIKKQQGLKLLLSWKSAWQNQQVGAYLSKYQPNYAPEGMTHRAWVNKRRRSLTKPSFIKIGLSNVRVNVLNAHKIQIIFNQAYQSDHYQDKVKKILILRLSSGKHPTWRIAKEIVVK